jgi:hypothetical protein
MRPQEWMERLEDLEPLELEERQRFQLLRLHSSLANGGGIPTNDASDSTIGVVQITAAPGSQISAAPVNPLRFDMTSLVGTPLSRVSFWLTDDQLRPVETLGEVWSVTVVIRYWV